MLYLASPYSSPDSEVRELRYEHACTACGHLMLLGKIVYSPIVQCHPIARLMALPTDWSFWRSHCMFFIVRSEELLVLKLEGWEASKGIAEEVALAELFSIPVGFVTLEDLVLRQS